MRVGSIVAKVTHSSYITLHNGARDAASHQGDFRLGGLRRGLGAWNYCVQTRCAEASQPAQSAQGHGRRPPPPPTEAAARQRLYTAGGSRFAPHRKEDSLPRKIKQPLIECTLHLSIPGSSSAEAFRNRLAGETVFYFFRFCFLFTLTLEASNRFPAAPPSPSSLGAW